MTSHPRAKPEDAAAAFVSWLVTGGVGPAVVFLPVNFLANKLAGAAVGWFKRYRQTDDLSRLVKAAAGPSAQLSRDEIKAVRKLLEEEETWRQLGQRDVTHLIDGIAACLSSDARAAAEAIARGLLEFAVWELDPAMFQKVVLTRLQQMTGQASELNKALYDLHNDLYARVDDAMDLLKRVIDRLPPGPANRGEIMIYLKTLIAWLNTDWWPRDQLLGGPTLTPAIIERKLKIESGEQVLDADDQAQLCERLVILGESGSGKTWFAKRTARICAEHALAVLEADAALAGTTLDEVELPLYTTCSQLFSAVGDIRRAAASSALDDMADPGSSRITDALREFFTRRDENTMLVLDSLDEATGDSRRLQQADKLPWRIVLTSRPSTWNWQLNIDKENPAHLVGNLLRLRYPEDVEPVIRRWFAARPERGHELTARIARHPSLQQAATVPLILAFYCILGGDQPLPEFRHELYADVLPLLLTASWHGLSGRPSEPDVQTCLGTLQSWACAGAVSSSVSGIQKWDDDLSVESISPGTERDAIDHIAPPRRFRDPRTGMTSRRFIHRSIREYLVAKHVASLQVDQAVTELLPHLWYDPDWEYTAPAAIAMHDKRDEVLRTLLCRAGRSDEIPGDLSVIDAGYQARILLARVAAESKEDDWSHELKTIIGQARVNLAEFGITGDLGEAAEWPTSNRQAREMLLGLLVRQTDSFVAAKLAVEVARFAVTSEDQRQARQALLRLLANPSHGKVAAGLINGLIQLNPKSTDKRRACEVLLHLLDGQTDSGQAAQLARGLAQLRPPTKDKDQARQALFRLLADPNIHNTVAMLVPHQLAALGPTPDDKQQARQALLVRLARDSGVLAGILIRELIQLSPTPADRRDAEVAVVGLLARRDYGVLDQHLIYGLAELTTTQTDRRQTRQALLALLADPAHREVAAQLAKGLAVLDPGPRDRGRARRVLLGLLDHPTDSRSVRGVAEAIIQLAPTTEEKNRTRRRLLALLNNQDVNEVAVQSAKGLAQLEPAKEEERQAREVVLGLLTRLAENWMAAQLPGRKGWHAATDQDKRQALQALLELLVSQADVGVARLALVAAELDLTAEEDRQNYERLLELLALAGTPQEGGELAGALAGLGPAEPDRSQARKALLGLLANQADGDVAAHLAERVAQLGATPKEMRQARKELLQILAHLTASHAATDTSGGEVQFDPTPPERHQPIDPEPIGVAREPYGTVPKLVSVVRLLAPGPEDKREVLDVLLGLLTRETSSAVAAALIRGVVPLDPTSHDLSAWQTWASPPTTELLATVRRNSVLEEWLQVLPSLSPLSD